jgi:hypothetical protein
MLKYMEDNNDKQNKFIKMLCDDIHISQKTLGTKYGRMCISSRQTSQGTQRIYTVNTTPIDRRRQDFDFDDDNNVQRAGQGSAASDSDSDDDCQKACQRSCGPSSNLTIDPEYEVSNDCMEDSPYLTQTAKTVMRSISYVSSSDSDDELPKLLPINSASEAEDDLTISP